jgi:hypothetical protein
VKRALGTLVALLLAGAALVAFNWALYHLIRTGTCASGGAYVSARACPKGTGGHILALMGGIFGGLIAVGIWAASRPLDRRGPGLGMVMWILGFALSGAVAILAAVGPANAGRADSKLGGIIVGAIFIPMGLAGLFAIGRSRGDMTSSAIRLNLGGVGGVPLTPARPPARPAPRPASSPTPGRGDVLSRLERLGELHGEGVLTDEEFAAQKRKLLGET